MKFRLLTHSISIALILCCAARAQETALTVKGRHLYTPCGEPVVMMGPNRMVYWLDRSGQSSFREIAAAGANAVRVVWTAEGKAAELDTVLTNARRFELIAVVELTDTNAAGHPQPPVDYWLREDIARVIERHQGYTIVNIGNRMGQETTREAYIDAYRHAVERLRQAGYKTPLMLDAPTWGRNIDALQAAGPALIAADPMANILLAVHMWWPQMWGYDERRIDTEIAESAAAGLPLVIAEFGNRWDDSEGGAIAYRSIIQRALEHDISFFPWSWGPGNKPQEHLDMSDDSTVQGLTGWGREIMLDEPYAIANNALKPDWECLVNGER